MDEKKRIEGEVTYEDGGKALALMFLFLFVVPFALSLAFFGR